MHWVKPELLVEVTYLTRTEDNLLRQVSYQAQREDKPARKVVRPFRILLDCAELAPSRLARSQPSRDGHISTTARYSHSHYSFPRRGKSAWRCKY